MAFTCYAILVAWYVAFLMEKEKDKATGTTMAQKVLVML